jgi:hypothetical protein
MDDKGLMGGIIRGGILVKNHIFGTKGKSFQGSKLDSLSTARVPGKLPGHFFYIFEMVSLHI